MVLVRVAAVRDPESFAVHLVSLDSQVLMFMFKEEYTRWARRFLER